MGHHFGISLLIKHVRHYTVLGKLDVEAFYYLLASGVVK